MSSRRAGAAGGGSGGQQLSVVVPTYNEVDNVRPLCQRLFASLKKAGITGEMLVMVGAW